MEGKNLMKLLQALFGKKYTWSSLQDLKLKTNNNMKTTQHQNQELTNEINSNIPLINNETEVNMNECAYEERNETTMKSKVDNYSIIIVCRYLQTENDFINIICVCKNYKKTLKKFRYNTIPIIN